MSTADNILYITLLFAFLLLGSMLTFLFLIHERVTAPPYRGWEPEDEKAPTGLLTQQEHEVWDAEPEEPPAIPLNPANPPVPRTFNPSQSRDPRDYPLCNCHNRRLTAGEEILWWPQPDGSVLIFHPDFISQMAKQ